MNELEKGEYLLKILSTIKIEVEGAKGAFDFTQSYTWLHKLVNDMKKPQEPIVSKEEPVVKKKTKKKTKKVTK